MLLGEPLSIQGDLQVTVEGSLEPGPHCHCPGQFTSSGLVVVESVHIDTQLLLFPSF